MTDENERQRFVMMGPGFGAGIGEGLVFLLWLACAGWVAAIGLGIAWWWFR